MTASQMITERIEHIPENELIFASKLYNENFQNILTESAYYQALGRMCKTGELYRLAKGTYYRPKISKFGAVPLSQKEIVSAFTQPDSGAVVGYSLYNSLKLTTQTSKTIEVFSSKLEQQTKNISNVFLRFCNLIFTPEVKEMIHMLDVLQNFNEIQDLDYNHFINFCENFVSKYDEKVLEQVIQQTHYQKRTISFLKSVLDHYEVPNNLTKYLASLSEYKHPTMEEIFKAAHVS